MGENSDCLQSTLSSMPIPLPLQALYFPPNSLAGGQREFKSSYFWLSSGLGMKVEF